MQSTSSAQSHGQVLPSFPKRSQQALQSLRQINRRSGQRQKGTDHNQKSQPQGNKDRLTHTFFLNGKPSPLKIDGAAFCDEDMEHHGKQDQNPDRLQTLQNIGERDWNNAAIQRKSDQNGIGDRIIGQKDQEWQKG